ncbi:MAG: TraB/GumN family protein [Rhizobacter sp.]
MRHLLAVLSRTRLAWVGLCLFAFATWVSAQDAVSCPAAPQMPTAAQVEAGMKSARDRGFLWRIQKDGRTSFLYGTVHVAKPGWGYPGPRLVEALRATQVVALELDMLNPAVLQAMQAGMAAAPKRELPAAMTQRLKLLMKALCVPDEALSSMSPEMLVSTLVVMAGRRDGLEPAWAIDVVYAGFAHGMKRSVISLETPALQLALLHGRTPAETLEIVTEALEELESPKLHTLLKRLTSDWAESNLDDMARYEQWCECEDTPAQREKAARMVDERNPAMAAKIDALHSGGQSVFAAVGSLHMIGPLGLPALMARRGYQVERVAFTAP